MREFYDPFKTGLFCYHKLIATVAESGSFKGPSCEKSCRCDRYFKTETFKHTLSDTRSGLKR